MMQAQLLLPRLFYLMNYLNYLVKSAAIILNLGRLILGIAFIFIMVRNLITAPH